MAKTELNDLGESTDDMVESTSKLRKDIKAMTGVEIMKDENSFKSTFTILKEISQVWSSLSDIDQANSLPVYIVIYTFNTFNCR